MLTYLFEIGCGGAGVHAHERAHVFAEARVGRGDDRDLGDAREPHHQLLHLGGGDVLAAANDDVLLAVGDRQETGGIEDAHVTAPEPAVAGERLVVECRVRVAREQVGAAALDLTRGTVGHGLAALVDDPQLDAR